LKLILSYSTSWDGIILPS